MQLNILIYTRVKKNSFALFKYKIFISGNLKLIKMKDPYGSIGKIPNSLKGILLSTTISNCREFNVDISDEFMTHKLSLNRMHILWLEKWWIMFKISLI